MKDTKIKIFIHLIISLSIIMNCPIISFASDSNITLKSSENHYNYKSIINHPKAIVRNSRKIGFVVSSIIGVPIAIIALPITGIMYAKTRKKRSYSNEDGEGMIFIMPWAIIGEIVGSITGGIAWLFFGWWGQKVKQLKKEITNELLPLDQKDAA